MSEHNTPMRDPIEDPAAAGLWPAPGSEPPRPVAAADTRPEPAGGSLPPSHARKRGRQAGGRIAGAVVLGMLLGGAIFAGGYMLAGSMQPAAPTPGPVKTVSTVAPDALEAAAAKLLPSVVNVAVGSGSSSGVGSGIIIRPDGYILTNFHVVDGATEISVRLGASDVPATLIGTDPSTDIAVIKVAKTGLPAATIGSSADLRVGETVLAIGSPFGLDKTVTSGIISALHRSNLTSGASGLTAYTNLIQTDAPINPGNSGGALADLSGALIGVNTLIQSPSGTLGAAQSAGIGFAIPIDFAMPIADQLIAGTPVTHPYLGIASATVTPAFAQLYGLSAESGALIQDVAPGSPAAVAGIRAGDIVVRFGTTEILTTEDVFAAVRASDVGTAIPVVLSRPGGDVTVSVTLVSR